MELIRRMRRGGYLESHNISDTDQFEIFEKLVDEVAGSGNVKLYFVVDRREFLDKLNRCTRRTRELAAVFVD